MDGNNPTTLVDEFLVHSQLGITEVGEVEVLDEEVGLVELFLGGEVKCHSYFDSWYGLEHGNKKFLDADVIVFAALVVFWTSEPEDVYILAQLGSLPISDEFLDRCLGDWGVGFGGDFLTLNRTGDELCE